MVLTGLPTTESRNSALSALDQPAAAVSTMAAKKPKGEVNEIINALEHLSTQNGSRPDVVQNKRDCFQVGLGSRERCAGGAQPTLSAGLCAAASHPPPPPPPPSLLPAAAGLLPSSCRS